MRAQVAPDSRRYSFPMDDDDYDGRPVGFMGKMRGGLKGLTWVLILSLIAITVGATSLLFLFQ